MKKYYFSNVFLLGLYLFIRQLHLSLDRSLDSDWKKLIGYFKDRNLVSNILARINDIYMIDIKTHIGERKILKPLVSTGILSNFFSRRNYLSEEELLFIASRLLSFATLLESKNQLDRDTLIELRMDLQHAEELVKSRIQKGSLKDKEYVEHLNQNEMLNCRSIRELVGEPWL